MNATTDTAPVLDMEARRLEALCANDPDAVAALLTDDFVYTHATGFSEGKTAYIDRMRSRSVRYHGLETRDVKARRYGGCVILDGISKLGYARSDGASGVIHSLFMATWVETASGWRLAGYASTPI